MINARTLATRLHRDPQGDQFKSMQDVPFDAPLMPLHLRALAVHLADLGLTPTVE